MTATSAAPDNLTQVRPWEPKRPAYGSEVDFDVCICEPIVDLVSAQRVGWRCYTHGMDWRFGAGAPAGAVRARCELRRGDRSRKARSERVSHFLSARDVRRLWTVYSRGRLMGLEMNAFMTISWAKLGLISDGEVSAAAEGLVNHLRDWATRTVDPVTGRKGLKVGWIWVHERGPLGGQVHTHFLASIPMRRRARFGAVVLSYLQRISEADPTQGLVVVDQHPGAEAGIIKVSQKRLKKRPASASAALHIGAPKRRPNGQEDRKRVRGFSVRCLKYMLKGVDPRASVRVNGLREPLTYWAGIGRTAPQGAIQGKRCGYSSFSLGDQAWAVWTQRHSADPDLLERQLEMSGPTYGAELHLVRQMIALNI